MPKSTATNIKYITDDVYVYLRGGLQNVLSPAEADDTQFVQAEGAEYRPPHLGVFAVGGRVDMGPDAVFSPTGGVSVFGGNFIHGISWLTFEGTGEPDDGYLVVYSAGSAYWTRAVEIDGAFSPKWNNMNGPTNSWLRFGNDESTGFAGATHYNNKWYFWNGITKNVVGPFVPPTVSSMEFKEEHGVPAVTASGFAEPVYGGVAGIEAGVYQMWHINAIGFEPDGLTNKQGAYHSVDAVEVTLTASGDIKYSFNAAPPSLNPNFDGFYVFSSVAGGKYPYGFSVQENGYDYDLATSVTITGLDVVHGYHITAPLGGVPVSTDGEPPIAYAMRVFQDSLVMIDAESRFNVKYTVPDTPHSVPSTYYIPFNLDLGDKLTALETINEVLLVFSRFYGFRVPNLPYAEDPEAVLTARSRFKSPFSRWQGCTGPMAVAAFSVYGEGELAMFASINGVHVTDGFKSEYSSNSLDWDLIVDKTELWRANMVNNPRRHRIELYVINLDGDVVRYDFYYHPKLLMANPGGAFPAFPVLGPTKVPGLAAAVSTLRGEYQVWNGRIDENRIFQEGTGVVDNALLQDATGSIVKNWKTKNFYLGGPDRSVIMNTLYLHQSEVTAQHTPTVKMNYLNDGGTNPIFTATGTWDMSKSRYQSLNGLYARSQGFNMEIVSTDASAWAELDYAVFVVDRPSTRQGPAQ